MTKSKETVYLERRKALLTKYNYYIGSRKNINDEIKSIKNQLDMIDVWLFGYLK